MKELEERTGIPRTTIHHYFREGLLEAPAKTARNAALYTDEHLARLEIIRDLRSGAYPVPLAVVRRALDLIDKGVAPDTAVALQRAVVGDPPTRGDFTSDLQGLASEAGVSHEFVASLVESGILVGLPASDPPFDALDLMVLERLIALSRVSGLQPDDLEEIALSLRKAVTLEMELRDRLVEGKTLTEAAEISRCGQLFVNVWHSYLTSRSRLLEIRNRGLGIDESVSESKQIPSRGEPRA